MFTIEEILASKDILDIDAKAGDTGIPADIWQTYCALANTAGGFILLGMEDRNRSGFYYPSGLRSAQKMMQEIWRGVNDRKNVSANILFRNHIYLQEYQGKDIVVVEVPRAWSRQKPLYTGADMFEGSYRRNQREDRKCSREEIQHMIREQDTHGADARLLRRWTLNDLETDTISRYRIVLKNIRPGHVYTRMGTDEFLVQIGAAGRGEDTKLHPTVAGMLFFGKAGPLAEEFPRVYLDYRELLPEGSGWSLRISSREGDWSGNLFDFYCRVIDRLTDGIRISYQPVSAGTSQEAARRFGNIAKARDALTRKVKECLSEAFVNALTHADYYGDGGIIIDKSPHFVSFANPGTFLADPRYVPEGGISVTRNENVGRLFDLIMAGCRPGEGLREIMQTWEACAMKPPQIMESFERGRVTVILGLAEPEEEEGGA
ncbi:MAG: putative DNA binding domain-containing protein [Blautia sp.]|nr:putative DNA binding domain-containing protein [Blautia sp.]